MPRANRRRRDEAPIDLARVSGGSTSTDRYAGGLWTVRRVSGATASRDYLCPGCHQDIAIGTPHVVAWPAEGVGGDDDLEKLVADYLDWDASAEYPLLMERFKQLVT